MEAKETKMTSADLTIDFSKLTPVELMFGEDFEETQQLAALFEEAELYLNSFAWCAGVKKVYFGMGLSDFIGIFLFEVVPSADERERYHWVVAGDVPPAHLAIANCPDAAFALKGYIEEMKGKVNLAQESELLRLAGFSGSSLQA
jgi:hypothetical protein